jgi:hypothetical protein
VYPGRILLAFTLTVAVPARGLAQTQSVHAVAKDQFDRAREAMDRGDYKAALDLLRASHAREPGRGKLLNMALCEEKLGLLGSAARHFEEVLPQLAGDPERERLAREHAEQLRPKVPYLRVSLAEAAPRGTTVTLDGNLLAPASLGVDVPIDPGRHVVVATATGAVEKRYEITLTGPERQELEVAPQAAAPAPARAEGAAPAPTVPPKIEPPSGDGSGSRMRVGGVVLLGVGAAGFVVAGVTGGIWLSKRSDISAQCNVATRTCNARGIDLIASTAPLDVASAVGWGVGLTGLAGGVALVVAGGKMQAAVAPTALPGGGGLWVTRRF